MNDEPLTDHDILQQFTVMRATGTAADGWVEAEVDGTGAVVELTINPRAMRLGAEDLAGAVKEAIARGRQLVSEQAVEVIPQSIRQDMSGVQASLSEAETEAKRNLNEILLAVDDLSAQLNRPK